MRSRKLPNTDVYIVPPVCAGQPIWKDRLPGEKRIGFDPVRESDFPAVRGVLDAQATELVLADALAGTAIAVVRADMISYRADPTSSHADQRRAE